MTYDFKEIEPKWQKTWEEKKAFCAVDNSPKEKFYSLSAKFRDSCQINGAFADGSIVHLEIARMENSSARGC